MDKPFWTVGVSAGPDSMALLDMLRRWGYRIVVVHVNYHQRESAARDQAICEAYCQHYQIPYVIVDAPEEPSGNFQDFARQTRMKAYREVSEHFQSKGVFLAHHQDDQLESIVFELLSKRTPDFLGIKEINRVDGLVLLRPLLSVSKEYLINYCKEHQIDYGLDETNFELSYSRNQIRHVLNDLEDEKKEILLKYQVAYNQRRDALLSKIAKSVKKQQLSLNDYRKVTEEERLILLRSFLEDKGVEVYQMSRAQLQSYDERLVDGKSQVIRLDDVYNLSIQYQKAQVWKRLSYEFEVKFDRIIYTTNEKFSTRPEGPSTSAVTLNKSDFPITIRNAREGDKIKLRFGTKKVSRFFIDRKIDFKERKGWPVVENSQGDIVLVVGLGCDVNHYSPKPNLFVLK